VGIALPGSHNKKLINKVARAVEKVYVKNILLGMLRK
jgi:hypothetical protein